MHHLCLSAGSAAERDRWVSAVNAHMMATLAVPTIMGGAGPATRPPSVPARSAEP
jgi:hypothetical protein